MKKEIVLYTYNNKDVKLAVDHDSETIWATQAEMASIFGTQRPAVTKHLNNIFKDKELKENSVCSILEHTATDGKVYNTKYYNLDAIISVGYRINSKQATNFRIWATSVLKQYINNGFIINRKILHNEKLQLFMNTVSDMKLLLTSEEFSKGDIDSILSLVATFADTWMSLDNYDKDTFAKSKTTKKKLKITVALLEEALNTLKQELIKKDEATDIFGQERNRGSIDGILGAVYQAFGGNDVYPSIEEKAANLLYLIVKNHPFVDGNKRSGAFAFVWFLSRAKILDVSKLSPSALTAITLLIAQSPANEKDKMVALVVNLIAKK